MARRSAARRRRDCPACPLRCRLRRVRERHARSLSRRRKAKRRAAASPRHRLVDRARRPCLAGPAARQGPARRHGRAARQRMDCRAASDRCASALGTVRHVFTHFALDLRDRAPRPSPSAKAGGSRSTASTRPACRRLYRRAAELALGSACTAAPLLEEARTRPVKGGQIQSASAPAPGKTSWTIASTPSPAGCCLRASSRSARRSSRAKFFHSERPGKDGLSDRGRRAGRRSAAPRPRSRSKSILAKADPAKGAAGVQEMHRLPQCRQGRRQPARPEPVGRARRADRPGQGLRFLRRRSPRRAAPGTGTISASG